jgi:hypothetical protein
MPCLSDDAAGTEEQRALEQPMGDEMEDRQREGPDTALHDHETHLAHGGVAEGLLDVVLTQHQDRTDHRGDQADNQHHMQDTIGVDIQGRKAIDQEAARIDDAGMHQGRHRRRTLHGVRQPGVQQELR